MNNTYKLFLHNNKGFSLVELLVSIGLMLLLFNIVMNIFFFMMRVWYNDNKMLELQQEARFSVDSIARDITYAKSFQIYSDRFEIITDVDNKPNAKIVYQLNHNASQCRLMRDNQPVTGETIVGKISVENFNIEALDTKTVLIKMSLIDTDTKQKFTIDTAATILNKKQEN